MKLLVATLMASIGLLYLTGFPVIGHRAYEVTASGGTGVGETCLPEENEPCVVRLSEPLALKPSKAPVHVP